MFTGIVDRTCPVERREARPDGCRLRVDLRPVASLDPSGEPWRDLELGESIAVNGCCLTLVDVDGRTLAFDVVAESLRRTALGGLQPGDLVNLERSLRVGDRLGGHYVTGHIDTTGTVVEFHRGADETLLRIGSPGGTPSFRVVPKGSVAVDGVSLTVAAVAADHFTVALIPHTLEITNLHALRVGDSVNLEMDHFGKWVEALASEREGR